MLDPATGAGRWTVTVVGEGTPVVAPDGSIALLARDPAILQVVESTGVIRHTTSIETDGAYVSDIEAVARDGTVLIGGDALWAIDAKGVARWKLEGESSAFIDAAGTVIVTQDKSIQGLALETGATLWTLNAPAGISCISETTLTSAGGIVATGCGNMLFGASD